MGPSGQVARQPLVTHWGFNLGISEVSTDVRIHSHLGSRKFLRCTPTYVGENGLVSDTYVSQGEKMRTRWEANINGVLKLVWRLLETIVLLTLTPRADLPCGRSSWYCPISPCFIELL